MERSEFESDDLERMFWTKLRARGAPAGTGLISCEWVDHPAQRHDRGAAAFRACGGHPIPFVWHFKEGPFICLEQGAWEKLVELYTRADGRIYSTAEMRDWFATVAPECAGDSLMPDGDLPKREWFAGDLPAANWDARRWPAAWMRACSSRTWSNSPAC